MNSIHNLTHIRTVAAYACYIVSCLFFLKTGSTFPLDSMPGALLAAGIAWVLTATMAWQWKAFGDPREIHSFVGHWLMGISIFLFIVRLATEVPDGDWSLLGVVVDTLTWANDLVGRIPKSIFEILRSPGIMILFVAVCLGLSLRRPIAIGVVATAFFAATIMALLRDDFGARLPFFIGLSSLALGLWLQANDSLRRNFWRPVVEALKDDPAPRGDLELKFRVLKRMFRIERPISEQEYLATISRATDRPVEDPHLQETARRILDQLVHADGLAEVALTSSGKRLALDPSLTEEKRDSYWMIANVPKVIFLVSVFAIWVISPIDLIPDTLPVVGVIDDATMGVLTALGLRNMLTTRVAKEPEESLGLLEEES